MLTPEEYTQLLRSFDVNQLLALVTIEAKRAHSGVFCISPRRGTFQQDTSLTAATASG